jgi:hypothetical protein
MNIFAVSNCPRECAQFLDDKRVVKMCLETAQILSTALRLNGYEGDNVYKKTHQKHPVVLWAAETRLNFLWLIEHLQALCSEYTRRYGKNHKCESMILDFLLLADIIPQGFQTPFANCAANQTKGISYKHVEDVNMAYRLYLNDRWDTDAREPTWKGTCL